MRIESLPQARGGLGDAGDRRTLSQFDPHFIVHLFESACFKVPFWHLLLPRLFPETSASARPVLRGRQLESGAAAGVIPWSVQVAAHLSRRAAESVLCLPRESGRLYKP